MQATVRGARGDRVAGIRTHLGDQLVLAAETISSTVDGVGRARPDAILTCSTESETEHYVLEEATR